MADPNSPADEKGQTQPINFPNPSQADLDKTMPMNLSGASEDTSVLPDDKRQTIRIKMPPPVETAKREAVSLPTPAIPGAGAAMPPPPMPKPPLGGLGGLKPPAPVPTPSIAGKMPGKPAGPDTTGIAPVAPKKETARIQIPPQPKGPTAGRSTVKLEENRPAPAVPSAFVPPTGVPSELAVASGPDLVVVALSGLTLVISLAAACFAYAASAA